MDSRNTNNRGVSILEAMAVVIIIVMLLSAIISNGMQRVQFAQYQKTVTEMQSIAQASLDYYQAQGSCPTGPSQLAPTYMAHAISSSPFNSSYQISCGVISVSVENTIPTGIARQNPGGPLMQITTSGGQDNITVTMTIPFQFSGRLLYEKNNP
jgi:Tfp pilus assembly protein PilV